MIIDPIPNDIENVSVEFSDLTLDQFKNLPLYAEIPGFNIDSKKLISQFNNDILGKYAAELKIYDAVKSPNRKFCGWSILSSNGDYKDGWQSLSAWENGKYNRILAEKNGFKPRKYHTVPTQLYGGYIKELHEQLINLGFIVRSMRIWGSYPKFRIGFHTDGANNVYSVRLHIPVITNDRCFHVWKVIPDDISFHMQVGKAYLMRTNIHHDAINNGETMRYHLVCDIWDVNGIVPEYKYFYPNNFN